MNDEWQEIPIKDVKPGDVARCNGREFPVESSADYRWGILLGRGNYYASWQGWTTFGFTFHRRVKRQPLSIEFTPTSVDVCFDSRAMVSPTTTFSVTLPGAYGRGCRFRVTEILDDEGNGGGG